MLADAPADRAEHGYLRWLAAFQSIPGRATTAAARAGFEEAAAAGARWGEPDLVALAGSGPAGP